MRTTEAVKHGKYVYNLAESMGGKRSLMLTFFLRLKHLDFVDPFIFLNVCHPLLSTCVLSGADYELTYENMVQWGVEQTLTVEDII